MTTNHRKAFLCVVALFVCFFALCPAVLGAVPNHTAEFYVNDYADVLSDETESYILSTAVQLKNETTAQVCVLTIDSLDGEDISEYSVDVIRQWGIGDKEKDNGVLIVLSVYDREMWIATGYGVEGTLTDTRLGQFRDTYAKPYYANDDFDTGTLELFNAIVNELRVEEYGLEGLEGFNENQSAYPGYYYEFNGSEISSEQISFILFLMALPFLAAIIGVPALVIRYNHLKRYDKLHGTQRTAAFMMKLNKIKEIITFIILLSRRSGRGGGHHRGGGGFGGGFGGGGGFRGGGGSTGGGGAGGKF